MDRLLERWYREHLGDPPAADHVYGYWAFVLGAAMAVAALGFLLLSTAYGPNDDLLWFNRQIAFTLALLAGPVIGLSVVYLLPLQERAVRIALAGLVICLLAVAAFNWAYPFNWNAGVDRSSAIMAVYGAGLLLQVLTVFAYPMATEETAQPAASPASTADATATGAAAGSGSTQSEDAGAAGSASVEAAADAAEAADSKASFQLYEDRGGEWRWRLVHQNGNVIADSGEGYSSRAKARQGLESVQTNAAGAEVLEPED